MVLSPSAHRVIESFIHSAASIDRSKRTGIHIHTPGVCKLGLVRRDGRAPRDDQALRGG